jgi:hypothetical protein
MRERTSFRHFVIRNLKKLRNNSFFLHLGLVRPGIESKRTIIAQIRVSRIRPSTCSANAIYFTHAITILRVMISLHHAKTIMMPLKNFSARPDITQNGIGRFLKSTRDQNTTRVIVVSASLSSWSVSQN